MRRVGGLLLVVALLSGCSLSGGAASKSAPRDQRWPPASVLAIEEPVVPPLDAPRTKAAAIDYSRYLVEEIDYALRTTFPGTILRTGTNYWGNRCEVCDFVVELAEGLRAERRRHEFRGWGGFVMDIEEIESQPSGSSTTFWELRLMLTQPETRTVDERGEVVRTTPRRNRDTVLILGRRSNEWRIYLWEFVEPAAAA